MKKNDNDTIENLKDNGIKESLSSLLKELKGHNIKDIFKNMMSDKLKEIILKYKNKY